MGCVLPEATFYSKLVAKTAGPVMPLALLWAWPAVCAIRGAGKTKLEHCTRFAAKFSLLWLELILTSVSTTIIETFVSLYLPNYRGMGNLCPINKCILWQVCSGYDGEYFLNAQMTLRCDGSPRRNAWLVFAGLAVGVYPLGQALYSQFYLYTTCTWPPYLATVRINLRETGA